MEIPQNDTKLNLLLPPDQLPIYQIKESTYQLISNRVYLISNALIHNTLMLVYIRKLL